MANRNRWWSWIGTAVLIGACMGSSDAQTLHIGGLSGKVVTIKGSANEVVFVTPPKKFFVLTQFCSLGSSSVAGALTSSTQGLVAVAPSGNNCSTYSPGIALPQNDTLTCGGMTECMIIGVLSSR
jgi:hypothetical protein